MNHIKTKQQDDCSGPDLPKAGTCRFCERIIPVQTTCSLTEQGLKSAAQHVAKLHAKQAVEAALSQPVKFAGEWTCFIEHRTFHDIL